MDNFFNQIKTAELLNALQTGKIINYHLLNYQFVQGC